MSLSKSIYISLSKCTTRTRYEKVKSDLTTMSSIAVYCVSTRVTANAARCTLSLMVIVGLIYFAYSCIISGAWNGLTPNMHQATTRANVAMLLNEALGAKVISNWRKCIFKRRPQDFNTFDYVWLHWINKLDWKSCPILHCPICCTNVSVLFIICRLVSQCLPSFMLV